MSNNSIRRTEYGLAEESIKRLERNALTGSRAIAGALARMSTVSNRSDEDHGVLTLAAWQQWSDWDNGHVDS